MARTQSAKSNGQKRARAGGNQRCRFRWPRILRVSLELLKRADPSRRPARVLISFEDGRDQVFAGEEARAIWVWSLTGAWMAGAGQPTARELPGISPSTRGILVECLRKFAAELETYSPTRDFPLNNPRKFPEFANSPENK